MMWILNYERVEYSKGKALELELLLNRIGSVFKPVEEETPDEESLQAALSAQVRKNEYKISIPVFSRRYDSFLTPIEIAPFHSSDPTPSCRSDLWYVPHYERTYTTNVPIL